MLRKPKRLDMPFSVLLKKRSKEILEQQISESLEQGDGWMHKWSTNELMPPPDVKVNGKLITNPNGILKHHSGEWSKQWKTDYPTKVAEVKKAIMELIREVNETGHGVPFDHEPATLRKAAGSFKSSTSIGIDTWGFGESEKMSDPVLASLGKLLKDIKNKAVPLVQMRMNLMASLQKTDGGIRNVAIAPTLYKLLMELDNLELDNIEQ